MRNFSLAALVPIIGLIPTVIAPIVARSNSSDFLFGLSSDYWAGFIGAAGVGMMLVVLSLHFKKQRAARDCSKI
ncbi:hypothetical protein HNQ53_002180 [Microbulbifer hydrolyticus]|uniref:Uncharacterized protein n=1 Tax=Microbulbifer hydrolyticus TaxID=48074 RepID=A0AA89PD93_9GAMM|nr:hypothetical protein [Microbulbifer hydrolyticus]